ncbi:MAG: helix-turn-helix transcriptional regulator [Bacteroidales bacterium]|jgi:putative transcriptional regulator|nr:helix-turn-helix transcriptional regulator [Bacteroidales bacterium]NLH34041.1 helix-turn-helix transcriptional regulator [Lentimicrobium sp.]OQC36699.1 MAG: anaerobic benzoate catabolism transcriptional regulator [Bacteroidetes bacterium ADurb.Bin041]MBP7873694.1 helix-turn-helix transcriptional regulator [Bacteroidales bacterium]MCZ2282774.1 helix-turn-helix transcriptional regulator [Bacteroidales bacterium]
MKNRIRVERAELGLTQEQVAEKIGVSRQTINAIEKGRYAPSVVLALKLARLFGKRVDDIFELETDD